MKTFGRPPAITSTLNFPPPTIFKDELLAGYRGRIALMNGLQSEKKVAQFLSAIHCGGYSQPHHTAAFIEGAAFVNSLGVDDLLHRHSFYRMTRGFASNIAYSELVKKDRVTAARLSMRNLSQRANLCPMCAETDLATHHFSYWRKRHQLPGRYTCPDHKCDLLLFDDTCLMERMPHEAQNYVGSVKQAGPTHFTENPCIRLALDILEKLNDLRVALDRDGCMAAFQAELRAQGEDPSQPRWFSEFSASIDAAFSLDWLRAAFSRGQFRVGTIRNFATACICDRSHTVSNLGMAVTLSMVFTTPDEALSAMLG